MNRKRGFTLIELMVVVSVIALLAMLLVPALTRAQRGVRRMNCASLLRGYAFATEMYVMDNNRVMMDSYMHLDPSVGIPRYWGGSRMPKNLGRCPEDARTEQLGRLGKFDKFDNAEVSIGCNENMLSCSARQTSVGPMAFWVERDKISGDANRLMTWTDWQNNPYVESPPYAVVKPTADKAGNHSIGSMVFRHVDNTCAAAYLDGHVGYIKANVRLINDGHDLAAEGKWTITGSVAQLYKCYYPFGVGASQTSGTNGSRGLWPDFSLR